MLLDKVSQAVGILTPEVVAETNDTKVRPLCQWYPQSTQTAQAVLQYNLAVALALKGDLEKAGDMLKQVSTM